ncbi:ubiquinol-cytochrome C chaperone family protein [Sphingomonas sp. 2R-10]|uniref:ubiquinol-cytochrome C chaperone family protein n=1 Tax=Sphingomonas sp. 2R-10 TaxID=3045148 RepID=UPI000F79A763|nr:ubiquinol-cytochrome C chaperone family protein [Sphingomonas sp. 2R-10]MDJ0275300.1 ubiquinol-cytochrome C chaperone family protein [Sphingomonas sp. 2R-10]
MRLPRLFRREPPPRVAATLYDAVVTRGRMPHWYLAGGVPDTLDGRFDMIAAVLAMVMLRLEGEGAGAAPAASLGECFVDDMDGQLRQIGFGDMVVGKHIGRMMAALGGRLGAYRDGLADGTLDAALVRNLYRGVEPDPAALTHVATELRTFRAALAPVSVDDLLSGKLP